MHLHKLIFQFKTLVDNKTFTAAAEVLCISQPTLTQNIKRLESSLEVSLLIRGNKHVSLTVYGESLYQHASMLDRSYRQALSDIDMIKRNHRQTLILECGHAWSHGLLFDLMKNYIAHYPDVRMVIRSANTVTGQNHLLRGDCDIALGAIPVLENRISGIHYVPVFTSQFMLFCSREHLWAPAESITEEQLARSDWVILRHEPDDGEFDDPLLWQIPPEKIRFEVYSVSSAITLVRQSQCLVALPRQLEHEATSRGLKPLKVDIEFAAFETGMMYTDDVLKHDHKKAFIDAIISEKSYFGQ
ncbi:LysR family transcriptional regulator [Buttiauxella selenatireducens]|uniref:LysR family transcriptional regulator n=1 Tax=Buttiauxella selenatireducens TaxID=3073902 RepID=A0ABY9S6A2_9ENTR|nr:LysR family transcriptional regulator [Buttiauxella sp. R73]WMY72533.1 LysR family transcriptional regulator [Buttiauxella sp. R73]